LKIRHRDIFNTYPTSGFSQTVHHRKNGKETLLGELLIYSVSELSGRGIQKLIQQHVSPKWQVVEEMVNTKRKMFLFERQWRENYRFLLFPRIKYRGVKRTYRVDLHTKKGKHRKMFLLVREPWDNLHFSVTKVSHRGVRNWVCCTKNFKYNFLCNEDFHFKQLKIT
jgi:hypothetical protein